MGMTKHDRLLHILNLLRTRRSMTAVKLADECGVTERTVYRDILSLSEMNVPIYYDNGYRLSSDNFLPPLNFTFDEYTLLRQALESSPLLETDKYKDVYRSLKVKIENCLSNHVREEKMFRPDTTHIESPSTIDDEDEGLRFFGLIEKAVNDKHSLDLEYLSVTSGMTQRKIDPYFIVFRGSAFYVVAYCHLRQDFRTFRLNRIKNITVLPDSFKRDPAVTPESYFQNSWSVYSGEPVKVVCLFTGKAARIISLSRHHPGEQVEQLDDNTVKYTVTTRGLEEIKRWLLGFGSEVTILEPTELRDDLFELGSWLLTTYGGKDPD